MTCAAKSGSYQESHGSYLMARYLCLVSAFVLPLHTEIDKLK